MYNAVMQEINAHVRAKALQGESKIFHEMTTSTSLLLNKPAGLYHLVTLLKVPQRSEEVISVISAAGRQCQQPCQEACFQLMLQLQVPDILHSRKEIRNAFCVTTSHLSALVYYMQPHSKQLH